MVCLFLLKFSKLVYTGKFENPIEVQLNPVETEGSPNDLCFPLRSYLYDSSQNLNIYSLYSLVTKGKPKSNTRLLLFFSLQISS